MSFLPALRYTFSYLYHPKTNRIVSKAFAHVLDADGDGNITLEEYNAVFDADGDGVVDAKEENMARSRMLDESQQIPGHRQLFKL